MPFIEADEEFKNAKEPVLAAEGKYDLRIVEADAYRGQTSGKSSVRVIIEFDGKPEYARIYHYISLANREADAKKDDEKGLPPGTTAKNKALMGKRFMHLFGIKWSPKGYDTNDFKGKTARADVTIDTQERPDGTISRSNRISLPSLPEGKS